MRLKKEGKRMEGEVFQVIACAWTVDQLRARQAAEGAAAWAEGDELTFVHIAEADEVRLCGGLQLPLQRLAQSDFWVLTVRVRDLSQAVISYGFVTNPTAQALNQAPIMAEWRGSQAPLPAQRAVPLRGQIKPCTLVSQVLGEQRSLTVYLPPNYNPLKTSPVLYAADGQAVPGLATTLEPLIADGTLPAILLVGVHSWAGQVAAPYHPTQDRRAQEYMPGINAERFAAHEQFFVDEVAAWAEHTFGASPRRDQRAVFGYSNGGVFAAAMGLRHPDRYGNVLAFSLGMAPDEAPPSFPKQAPAFYLLAGTLEQGFHTATAAFAATLQAQAVESVFRERVCGHDFIMWQEEFPNAVGWAFGQR